MTWLPWVGIVTGGLSMLIGGSRRRPNLQQISRVVVEPDEVLPNGDVRQGRTLVQYR